MTHLLIVDDDIELSNMLADYLQAESFDVEQVFDGETGVHSALSSDFDAIILDVMMPVLDGFEVLRRIRSHTSVPVIMLTVRAEEMDKIIGLEMGADDYMTKPFSLRELLSRVRAQLRRAYGEYTLSEGELLYAGDLVIDRGRGQVLRGEYDLHLTPTELRLLTYLAQHPNQVLSRGQILDAVWGYDTIPFTRTVDTHVAKLRKKIEDDPSDPTHLITVHRLGYKFVG